MGQKKSLLLVFLLLLLTASMASFARAAVFVDTTNEDFGAGTLFKTNITGSGADANVTLNVTNQEFLIYEISGNFTSRVFDNGKITAFGNISWSSFLANSSDVLGYAIDSGVNDIGVFYRNGSIATDTSQLNLNSDISFTDLRKYSLPSDFSKEDIVGFSWDDDGTAAIFAFFRNGSVAIGTQTDLTTDVVFATTGSFALPSGFNVSDAIGMAIDADNEATAVFFKNGSYVRADTEVAPFNFNSVLAYSLPSGFDSDNAIGIAYDRNQEDVAMFFRNGSFVSDTTQTNFNTDIVFDTILAATYNSDFNLTAYTNITLQTRVSNDSVTFTPWSRIYTNSNGSESVEDYLARYIQYKAVLKTPDKYVTPFLENVSISITNDTIPPTVNALLNQSFSGIRINDLINISANATDNINLDAGQIIVNISGVKQFFNFSLSGTSSQLSSKISISVPRGQVINFTVLANDTLGNTKMNDTVITVQDSAPTFTIANNNSNPKISQDVQISALTSDADTLSSIIFSWNGTNGAWQNVSNTSLASTASNYTVNITVGLARGNTIGFLFHSNDSVVANFTASSLNTFTVADTIGSISLGLNGTDLRIGGVVNVSGNITEPDGDISFGWVVDNRTGTNINPPTPLSGYNANFSNSILINVTRGNVINFTVFYNDTIGTIVQTSNFVTVLNTAPSAPTILVPANNANTSSRQLNATFPADADGDAITINYYINGTINSSISTNATFNGADGNYVLNISLFDGFNSSQNSTVSFKLDTTSPTAAFVRPSNISSVTGTITVNVSVADATSGAKNATLTNGNSVSLMSLTTGDTFSGNWIAQIDTTAFTDGYNIFTVNATDFSGNSNSNVFINLTVDNLGPNVVFNSPANNSNLSGTKSVNITVTDATTSVSTVLASLVNISGSTVLNLTLSQDGSNYNDTFDTTAFTDGTYNISIFANDTVGKTTISNRNITIDNTKPIIRVVSPQNNSFVNSGLQQVIFNITDGTSGVKTSSINSSTFRYTFSGFTFSASPITFSQITNGFLANGTVDLGSNEARVNVTVSAQDYAENTVPVMFWTYTIDLTFPKVNSISLNDSDSKLRSAASVRVTVNATNGAAGIAAVNLSNTSIVSASQSTGDLWIANTTPSALGCSSEGNCTVRIYARDGAGNLNSSETITLWIDNSAPNASVAVDDADLKVRSSDSLLFNATINDANFDSGSTITIGNSSTVSLSRYNTSNEMSKWSVTTTASALGCPSNGECTARLTATDIAGNINNTKTITLTVDSLAPNVTIAINSSTNVNNITVLKINVTAADTNTVSNVSINNTRLSSIGGNIWQTINSTYQLCPGIVDSTCTLRVTAYDKVSNSNSSETLTLTINSFAPSISGIPDIAFNEDGHNATVNLSQFITDQDTQINDITVSALGNNSVTVRINQTTKMLNVSAGSNFNGQETIVFTASDGVSTVSDTITVTVNSVNDAPTAPSLSSPANNSNVSASFASLDWASSTDADGNTITYYVFFGNSTSPSLNATVQDSNLTIANITKGQTYYWKVIASDNTLNSSNSSRFQFLATANTAPVLGSQVQNLTWLEDTSNSSINLSAKFSDNEGDALTFSSTTPSNVAVSISQATGIVTLTPSSNFVGINNITFTASDGTNSTSSNLVILTIMNANDAPSISSFSPTQNTSVAVNTGSQRFDVVFADIDAGDRPTSSWFRNGTSIAPSNSSNVTVSSLNAGIYNITVLITDNASATARYEWKLTATNTINSSGLTSPVLSLNESQRQAAANVSINQTTSGGIDFGSNILNFSGVVNLEDAFNISNGLVSVNTNTYPGLNKSAYIVMKGLNFTKAPLIYTASGFESTSNGVLCSNTTCANITYDSTNKILRFNAAHFTTFFTQQNTTNGAPTITSSARTTATVNEQYRYDVEASDPDGDTLSFSLTTAPSGMSISSSSGLITFTPSSLGNFSVTVQVSDGSLTASQSYNLTVGEGARLSITDLDVKVGKSTDKNLDNSTRISKEAAPGDKVEFDLKIKNMFTNAENLEIEDITVDVTIEEIDDGDDLEEEADEFSLDADDDDSVSLEFEVPLDVEEDTFDVIIDVEGDDENGTTHRVRWELQLDVEKENHEIRVIRASATPSDVACGRSVSINTEIINTGSQDEDDVTLEIVGAALGINSVTEAIELDEGTDDNRYSKLLTANIGEDIGPGSYPVDVNAYYDDKLSGSETIHINVGQCERTRTVSEPVAEKPKVTVTTPKAQAAQQPEQAMAIRVSTDKSLYYTMLAIMIVIFLGTAIFVVGAGFMFLGRR